MTKSSATTNEAGIYRFDAVDLGTVSLPVGFLVLIQTIA